MSNAWQAYITEITKDGFVSNAMICGATDALKWAASPNFETKNDAGQVIQKDINEKQEVLNCFKNIGNVPSFYLNGKKFQILNFDEEDKKIYFRSGKAGGCMVMTKMCILIGTFDSAKNKNHTAGDCNQSVERIADSLIAANY